jgi:hypothetical protein
VTGRTTSCAPTVIRTRRPRSFASVTDRPVFAQTATASRCTRPNATNTSTPRSRSLILSVLLPPGISLTPTRRSNCRQRSASHFATPLHAPTTAPDPGNEHREGPGSGAGRRAQTASQSEVAGGAPSTSFLTSNRTRLRRLHEPICREAGRFAGAPPSRGGCRAQRSLCATASAQGSSARADPRESPWRMERGSAGDFIVPDGVR